MTTAAPAIMNSPEFAFTFTQMIAQGMAQEMKTTRKVLAAIPEGQKEFRPDPKARTAFELAWHIASGDVQFLEDIADRKFKMEPRFPDAPKTMAELLTWYDSNFPRALARVQAMKPQELATPVDFYGVMNLPVFNYLAFANNHSIHHRGQLATYLRPMGSKVPQIYGGSADEPWG